VSESRRESPSFSHRTKNCTTSRLTRLTSFMSNTMGLDSAVISDSNCVTFSVSFARPREIQQTLRSRISGSLASRAPTAKTVPNAKRSLRVNVHHVRPLRAPPLPLIIVSSALADRPFPVQALTFLFVSRLETARRMERLFFFPVSPFFSWRLQRRGSLRQEVVNKTRVMPTVPTSVMTSVRDRAGVCQRRG
jgi:hypothetical protein